MADADEVKNYFQLEFGIDKEGRTELKLKGPEIPGTVTSPIIAFHKKNGKFVFKIGVEIHEVAANELADDFKSFFNEARRSDRRIGPLPVLMPPRKCSSVMTILLNYMGITNETRLYLPASRQKTKKLIIQTIK